MTEEVKGEEIVEEKHQEGEHNYGELIAESKAYRKRAQEAEERLAAIERERKEAEEAKLREQGEYKELLAQREAELEAFKNKASDWDNYQQAKKEEILKGMTEAQAEIYKGLDLTTLENIARDLKINAGGGKAPSDRPGQNQSGKKFNGHESLSAWAAHAAKMGGKELEIYRTRNGDYPR